MNKRHWSAASGLAVGALVVSGLSLPMQAQAAPGGGAPTSSDPAAASRPDDLPNPLADAAAAERKDAIAKLVRGDATTRTINGNRVIEVKSTGKDAKGKAMQSKYVNYPVEREEDIFTVLVDFGDKIDPNTGGTAGPRAQPDPEAGPDWDGNATDDNSTYWVKDFDRAHYQDLMFGSGESFKDFYLKQSNGRFLAKGDVSDWVKVPFNEARYGSNTSPDSATYWPFIKDTGNAWYDAQKAAGKSDAEIKTYLAQFDKVDRYDFDKDGNFNEPDGYIDHFQAIHAGEGEEAGGGAQGADAIWSHRWYAYSTTPARPAPRGNQAGGAPIGNSGIWIGDYTTEPENGGLGVFAHEFGHDLGLPDLYDTAGGDNGTGFWTLMSRRLVAEPRHRLDRHHARLHGPVGEAPARLARLHDGARSARTDGQARPGRPGHARRPAGRRRPAARTSTVITKHNTPHSGTGEWWSGFGDNLTSTLARSVDLTGATLGRGQRLGAG